MGVLTRLLDRVGVGSVKDRDLYRRYGVKLSSAHPGWPEETQVLHVPGGSVRLRPVVKDDGPEWARLRRNDEATLRAVEPTATDSWDEVHTVPSWLSVVDSLYESAARGASVPFAVECDGKFAGQVTVGGIQHGSLSTCWIGYWIASPIWGRGVGTAAVALGVDAAMMSVGVHRVEATVLPENAASISVLENVGFHYEGELVRSINIDGQWRDHFLYALTSEECPGGVVSWLESSGRGRRES